MLGSLLGLPGFAPGLRAATVTVRPGASLPAVLQTLAAGDTLVVNPGLYEGNLLLDRRIALMGEEGAVLRGSGTGSVVTILADSCVLQGFIVEHSGSRLVDEDAGILVKSSGNRICNNSFRDILFGIYLLHAGGNEIRGNSIAGRKHLDLGDRGSGIHIWNSPRNRVVRNTIVDVRDGLYIQNANHTWIEANRVSGVRYGLHYMYADSNIFLGNRFSDNVAGAAIMYSRGIIMRHNVFTHNRGFASFGILFQDCHGLLADSNVIADNVVGMFFEGSTHNQFCDNIIAQNDIALQMFQNSNDNIITGNNFIDNLSPLAIIGKRTGTCWNTSSGGNYWSSYDGYDLDADGVGDIPMKIQNVFQYLEGRNANVRLFLYSPASQALAKSAEAFPILQINEETDARPLMHPRDLGQMPAVQMMRGEQQAGKRLRRTAWLLFPLVAVALFGMIVRRQNRGIPR